MGKDRPGTMLYFDLFYDIEDYTDEEAGQLLRAMLSYGMNGDIPQFQDRGMRTIWRKLQSTIDRDGDTYDRVVLQRKYAAYCKKMKKAEQDAISFEEWISYNDYATTEHRNTTTVETRVSEQNPRYPTSTSSSSLTSSLSSTTTTTNQSSPSSDPNLSRVMTAFMDKINPFPSTSSLDELKNFYEKMGAECCLRAIDSALDNGKRTWSYIKGILQNKLKEGVRNIDDWDRLETEYRQRKDQKPPVFVPPTVEDVRKYCKEHKINVDPEHFVYYFKARGWKFANNQQMEDWKSALMSWNSNEPKHGSGDSNNGGLPFLT